MNWWFGDFWSDFAFGIRFKRLEFNLVCAIGFDSRLLYAKKEIWLLGYNFRAYLPGKGRSDDGLMARWMCKFTI